MDTQHLIRIIEIIIWPATLIVVLILFKKNIKSIFDRVGSFEASATGLSMTFQEKIEETKKSDARLYSYIFESDCEVTISQIHNEINNQILQGKTVMGILNNFNNLNTIINV